MRLPFALLLALSLNLAALAQDKKPAAKAAGPLQATTPPAPDTTGSAKLKLMLKDGNYQLVRSYQRQGDRVRYFSLERGEWEELPASLVDWKATEEVNRQEQGEALRKAEELDKEEQASRANPRQMLGPEIAPGLFLPDEDGLYVVRNGQVVALPKQQAAARIDKGRLATNVLLPVPLLKNRNLVEVPGARAQLRLDDSPATLYANGRASDDSRYALVRLKPKGDVRQVEAILTNVLGRNPSHSGEYIELDSQTVAPNVFKLTPRQTLPPGEYAVVEFIGKNLNLFLWDFGVGK